jgi:hypothetical protein
MKGLDQMIDHGRLADDLPRFVLVQRLLLGHICLRAVTHLIAANGYDGKIPRGATSGMELF